MVNAATDIEYNGVFYAEGTKLPEQVVKRFEIADPSLLSNHIEVNGRWFNVDDKRIKGYVQVNKRILRRLRLHFNIKDEPVKKEEKVVPKKEEVKEVKPKETKFTKEQLESFSFKRLRAIGKKVGTKGRGKKELVKEILELQ